MNRKPFAFWAKWIAITWVGSFAVVFASIVIVLQFLNIGGLTSVQVREAIQQLLGIYLPFLGIIFGAFAFAFKMRRWSDEPVDSGFPALVIFISALFNFLMLVWTFSFLFGQYANIEDYLADIKIFAAAMAFFIGWFLTYFFQEGYGTEGSCENKSGQSPASPPASDKNA